MTSPFLANDRSGFGGRGYKTIFDPEPALVPSVTTVLNVIEKPGVVHWAVQQTCAFYAANPDYSLTHTEEQAYRFGQWYYKRTPDVDSPEYQAQDYWQGVLHDLQEQGTDVHAFFESEVQGLFDTPEPKNEAQAQMFNEIVLWLMDNKVEPLAVERTVYGDGYAGTLDLIARINGEVYLVDVKTSRKVYDTHISQLGALGAAHTMAVEVPEGTEGAVSHTRTSGGKKETRWFIQEPLPAFSRYAVLRVRPDDVDDNGVLVPASCTLHEVSPEEVEAGYEMFRGALTIKQAERRMKDIRKGER